MYMAESLGFSKSEAFVIDWQYRYGGDFTTALAELLVRADESNLERIMLAFPDETEGFLNYSRVPGWWQDLQSRFKSSLATKHSS